MRILSRFFAAFAAFIFAVGVANAQPVITAFIGTPTATSHIGYFVLDFDAIGANPETYAFGWNYEGTPTGTDFLTALQTGLSGPNGFTQEGQLFPFGYLVQEIGYNGRNRSSLIETGGYWNLWLGFDGANWTSSQFGSSDVVLSDTPIFTGVNLSGSSWQGWRWVKDFNPDSPQPPRTPTVAVAASEPATVGYWVLGVGCWVLGQRKRLV